MASPCSSINWTSVFCIICIDYQLYFRTPGTPPTCSKLTPDIGRGAGAGAGAGAGGAAPGPGEQEQEQEQE